MGLKVLLVNGSPRPKGCTATALAEVAGTLAQNGIETELMQIGNGPVRGCIACMACRKQALGKCVFDDDPANGILAAAAKADGLVIGSPVYYAGVNGALCSLLDRVFYAGSDQLAYKPGAAVLSCRRGGASAAFDRLGKYFTISKMPVVSSQYWNAVHGNTPQEVLQDLEGMQIMRTLGANMAWMLKSIHQGVQPLPRQEEPVATNFIR